MHGKPLQLLLEGPSVNRNVSLTKKLDQALRDQAEREDRTISRVVRRALVQYLEQQQQQQHAT